ncbi:MAG: GTP-binding protein [Candidatus Lokiarchaeota archaeon]|nr:GTP-binding protein [Candidatus Harpocratesius repetitus]
MTIKHVNILTIDGKSLLFREYGATKVDQDLLAGFLSAFSGFMMEISQAEIKSTITGNSKFIYSIAHDIIVVICTDIYDQEEEISPKIESIMEGFWSRYHTIFENNDWDGERTVFKEFKQEIDRIILGPIKVSILGYAGVGKTTLTRLIVGEEVNLEYVPTITADIANFDKLGPRKIVLWDFAGQIQFTDLWDSLLRGTRIVLLVTDSTYTNVQETKKILERFLTKRYKEAIIIGIANKQDLSNRLTPQFIEKILNIPTYAMISINPDHRIIILEILKKIIDSINEQDGLLKK